MTACRYASADSHRAPETELCSVRIKGSARLDAEVVASRHAHTPPPPPPRKSSARLPPATDTRRAGGSESHGGEVHAAVGREKEERGEA